MIKVLFLAANPSDTTRLRVDEESRAIDQALRLAEFRDRFELVQHWAVSVADLQGLLLRHNPDIVHFSGHGSEDSEIILEDQAGYSQPVPVQALSRLFSILKDHVRCVVLNACYSVEQAQAIAQYIDCVIGMSDAIDDRASIGFAASFYQALAYGRDVKTAFELGCVQIDMENLTGQDIPQLLSTKRSPSEIFLTRGRETIDNATDDSIDEMSSDKIRRKQVTVFDQRGQKVSYQYNSAGNINIGAVQNSTDIVELLKTILAETTKATEGNAIDEETSTEVKYRLEKAIQQAKKPEPDKKSILDYLKDTSELVSGTATGVVAVKGLITALTQAMELVQKFF